MMNVYDMLMGRVIEQADLKLTSEETEIVRKEFFQRVLSKIGSEYASHEAAVLRGLLLQKAVEDPETQALVRELVVGAIRAYLERKRDFDYFMRDVLAAVAREEISRQIVYELNRREDAAKAKAALSKRMAKSRKAKAL